MLIQLSKISRKGPTQVLVLDWTGQELSQHKTNQNVEDVKILHCWGSRSPSKEGGIIPLFMAAAEHATHEAATKCVDKLDQNLERVHGLRIQDVAVAIITDMDPGLIRGNSFATFSTELVLCCSIAICKLNLETPHDFSTRRHLEVRGFQDADEDKIPYSFCNVHLPRCRQACLQYRTPFGKISKTQKRQNIGLEMTLWHMISRERIFETVDDVSFVFDT